MPAKDIINCMLYFYPCVLFSLLLSIFYPRVIFEIATIGGTFLFLTRATGVKFVLLERTLQNYSCHKVGKYIYRHSGSGDGWIEWSKRRAVA